MLRLSSAIVHFSEGQRKQIQRLKQRSLEELNSLSPGFRKNVETILLHLEGKGWVPVVYHGSRTVEEQAEIVKAGHSKTMKSFHVEHTLLSKGRNGVYWQETGEAADIVDARYLWAGPAADLDFQFWIDLGVLAKALGLEWGGDWKKFKDVAHVQTTQMQISQDTRHVIV